MRRPLAERSDLPERMDAVGLDREVLARSLDRISAVTDRFGGCRAICREIVDLDLDEPASVLDVGTGGLALPLDIRSRLGSEVGRLVGIDVHPDVVWLAAEAARTHRRSDPARGAIQVVQGDARRLPFPTASFDVVVSSLTLHHLDRPEATAMLAEMGRVAATKVVVWDLGRSLHGFIGATLFAHTVWRKDPLVSYDAPLSVRKAYRIPEVREMAIEAGLASPRVGRSGLGHLMLSAAPGSRGR